MWDVRVCVACLATDVRMYSMSTSSLLQPYQLLAGVQMNDGMPQKLCWECAALVNKFNLFRHKCERAYLLLQDIYNQHDEIIEQHVNETDRVQHHLSSSLGITHIPSYTLTSRNVTVMRDTSTELATCFVKTELDNVKVEYSRPKTEPSFKSEPFVNCDEMVDNLDDGVENDMKEVIESEETFQFELNLTKADTPSLPSFSGKEEAIPRDAWTEIIFTQEQVNQIYKQKKNSLEFERATLKCELCYTVFKQPQYYPRHMLKHQPSSGPYECDFCKVRYRTKKHMTRHMKGHIRKYKCNICSTASTTRQFIKSHFRRHQKLGPVLRPKKSRRRKREKRKAVLKKLSRKVKRKAKKEKRNDPMEFEAVESLLTQEEMMAVVRERQLAKGYDTAPFKCHLCFKVFLVKKTYSQHMTTHDPACGEFECDVCKIRARTRRILQKHITSGHMRKYTCNICATVTYNRCVARDHYKQHKGVKFVCHVCAATFSREAAMQLHVHKKHPAFAMTSNVCGDCGASFQTFKGLACHKNKMHQVVTVSEENAPYCEECKVQFASRKAWTKHVLNSESHKNLQKNIVNGCIECGETFHTNAALRKHRKEQHPDKNFARENAIFCRKPQPCALCREQMTSASEHWAHHLRCHPGVPYVAVTRARNTCEQCGKRFNTKAILEQHRVKHTGPPPLQCSMCPKAFYMDLNLKHHLISHSEERPHKCDTCGKSFKFKMALKRHLIVHTGERPYACNKCEKAFTDRQWLQMHIRKVHNKEHIPTKPRIRKKKPPV